MEGFSDETNKNVEEIFQVTFFQLLLYHFEQPGPYVDFECNISMTWPNSNGKL